MRTPFAEFGGGTTTRTSSSAGTAAERGPWAIITKVSVTTSDGASKVAILSRYGYPQLGDRDRKTLTLNWLQALALDLCHSGGAWIIVFTNGEVAYTRRSSKTQTRFDHFEFEEFATRNFGCDFGLIEESKMEGTPRSSNPMSLPNSD